MNFRSCCSPQKLYLSFFFFRFRLYRPVCVFYISAVAPAYRPVAAVSAGKPVVDPQRPYVYLSSEDAFRCFLYARYDIVLEQDGKLIYNGMNQTPVVQKVSSRGLTVPADDYQIQVNAQKEAGSYPLTALITNEDSNFTGSVETTWQIIPKEEKEEPKEDVRPADPVPVQQDLFWLSSVSQKKRSIELTWTSIPNATSYVIYGNQCGKKMKKLMTVAYGNSFRVKKVGKKLKKGKYYKFQVDAVDSAGTVLATSNLIHVATKGGSVTNFRTVRIASSLLDKAASLKPGETLNLKAKGVKQNKRRKVRIHKRISYLSTNQEVASVSEKGIIQAKAPGRCLVYAYTQSGTRVGVEVVVSQEG